MVDESPLPGWACLCDDDGDVALVKNMLASHGVASEVVPVGTTARYSKLTLWVRDLDFDRACTLLEGMNAAFSAPPGADWRCGGCAEHNEGQFDFCWKCGRGRPE